MILNCKIWSSLHSMKLCAKFGWNWPNGSSEEKFWISPMYFCDFVIISPWKRAWPFIKKTWIPFIQGRFMPSLAEIGRVVQERRFRQCIFPWKRKGPFTRINFNPLHPRKLCVKLVEIGPVVVEKKIFKFCQCIFAIS